MLERKPEGLGGGLAERQKEEQRPGRDRQTEGEGRVEGEEGEGKKEGKEERKTSAPDRMWRAPRRTSPPMWPGRSP